MARKEKKAKAGALYRTRVDCFWNGSYRRAGEVVVVPDGKKAPKYFEPFTERKTSHAPDQQDGPPS